MTDIDKLEAGRELDALVAEKVMGWREDAYHYWGAPGSSSTLWVVAGSTEDHHGNTVWSPSTDIVAAWKVLRCLASLRIGADRHPARDGRIGLYKPVFRIEAYEHDDEYSVVIGRCKCTGMDDDVVCRQMGGDFDSVVPLLICRAALKVVGVVI